MTHGSFLLKKHPPTGPAAKEARVWWAVLRQAAHDVVHGDRTEAWDGAEFLRYTGWWLAESLFNIPYEDTQKELLKLMRLSRTGAFDEALDDN